MSEIQEWFYTDSTGAEHGPVSADELKQLGATGAIHALTDVWTEGLEAWVPASEIEGVIPVPPAPPVTPPPVPPKPAHQPHINLGGTGGIHLESTITPRPMGQPGVSPYGKTPKSPVKWIVLGVIALVVIVFAIIIATAPSEEEKRENIPGYAEYSNANSLLSSKKEGAIIGNNQEAVEIARSFSTMIKTYRELAIEKASPGLLNKNGTFPTYCMAKTEGDVKTVVIIVQVPKLRKFADDAKETIATGAWLSAKLALKDGPYDDKNTRLVVGLRGLTIYSKVMIGNPVFTESPNDKPLEGVTESHDGINSEEKLYPFFERKK